ncbi:MAG: very short patch repair endonuclease [Kiritimatiellales bacterium]|nr:very short patch repair endonuclease [Kiritimatiellales bacterium]
MSKIRGKNTKPELFVRSLLHRAGYRFSLHRKELPGKPDIVLRKYKTVVFVHGCFWHRHKGCKTASMPKTNVEFWQQKFERNVSNDRKHKRDLKKLGWKVIVVWECELKNPDKVLDRLQKFLPTDYADDTDKVIHYPTAEAVQLKAAESGAEYSATKRRKRHKE